MADLLATACERGDQPAVRLDGHVPACAGLQAAAAAVVPRVEVIMTESETPHRRLVPAIRLPRRDRGDRPRRRWLRRAARCAVVIVAALTAASFGYNLATGPATRPPGLRMLSAGGFDTRYRTWGTSGSPVILVPGAFETADTFAALGAALGTDHRVFAIDLTGTGYSTPSPPYTAGHLADQLLAFLAAQGLTGANAPVLVGHSSGAAVAGIAAAATSRPASCSSTATRGRWESRPHWAGC